MTLSYDELYELGMADKGRISIFPVFPINLPTPPIAAAFRRDGVMASLPDGDPPNTNAAAK